MYFSLRCHGNTANFFLPIGDPINVVSLYHIVGPTLCTKDIIQSESFSVLIFLILLHYFIFSLFFYLGSSILAYPKKVPIGSLNSFRICSKI